jgi:hypothetical protein
MPKKPEFLGVYVNTKKFFMIVSDMRKQPYTSNYKEYLPSTCIYTKEGNMFYYIPLY